MDNGFLTEVKELVAEPGAGPRLSDLVNATAGHLIVRLTGDEFDVAAPPSIDGVIDRLDRYVILTTDLARAVALGTRWSGEAVRPIWPSVIERVVEAVDRAHGQAMWTDLSLYPGVLLLYASGIGALAGGRYDTLRAVLLEPRLNFHSRWQSAVERLYPAAVLDDRQAARVPDLPRTFAPLSDRAAADVRPLMADIVPDDRAFDRLFDRFEYLLGLTYVDVTKNGWGPTGRFVADQYGTGIDQVIEAEIAEAGASWAPLRCGLFAGSAERLGESLTRWRKHVEAVRNEARWHSVR